jgi:hypothetical protein
VVLGNSKSGRHQTGLASRSLRVLVLDEWIPYPPDSGRGVRTWSLLQRLARRHKVSSLCYGDPEAEASVAARAAGISLHLVRPFPASRASLPLKASQVAPRFGGLSTSR